MMVKPEFKPFTLEIDGASEFYVKSGNNLILDFSGSAMTTGYNFIKPEWLVPQVSSLVFRNFYKCELKNTLKKLSGFENSAFTTSGTEACDTALTRYGFPVISLEGAYHGLTYLTKIVSNGTGYDINNRIIHLKIPDNKISVENAIEYNNSLIKKSPFSLDNGTVIIELIQSDGGVNVLPKEFINYIIEISKNLGFHLIVDEVYTGYGRSGEMFLFKKYNIKPDMVCIGKGMAAGLPLGAVLYNNSWDLPYNDVLSMQGGNMFTSRVALEVIKSLDEKRLDFVRNNGVNIIKKLLKISNDKISSVRGLGFMIGIEFSDDVGNPDPEYALNIRNRLFSDNLACSLTGESNNVLKITPPVLIDKETLDSGIEKIINVLEG